MTKQRNNKVELATLETAELKAKLRWYEARGEKFRTQIDAIKCEMISRCVKRGSVVKPDYKHGYAAKGNARGNGDWLFEALAIYALDRDGKLKIADFEAILDANGVKHAHWNRTTPGWQGRLRMSGGVALRSRIAKDGIFHVPGCGSIEVPNDFCARYA